LSLGKNLFFSGFLSPETETI